MLVKRLKSAKKVAVLTGAGVSAESKIPTFRDAMTGLWAKYEPTELATPQAFARDPKLVWDWYAWRRELVADAAPNPGHEAIARMETLFDDFLLITQNVDSLHQRAGSTKLVELHGNISRVKCSREHVVVTPIPESDQTPPPCPHCGAHLRPDVVWFGESLPMKALEAAQQAAANCDVFFSVGTSAVVEPAASLIFFALNNGADTVEVNPNPTGQAHLVHHTLMGPSGQALPALLAALEA